MCKQDSNGYPEHCRALQGLVLLLGVSMQEDKRKHVKQIQRRSRPLSCQGSVLGGSASRWRGVGITVTPLQRGHGHCQKRTFPIVVLCCLLKRNGGHALDN